MKRFFSLMMVLLVFSASAQDSTGIRLIEKSKIELDSLAYWNMDVLGNHLISLNGTISKIDTAGKTRYTQSIKSYGKTTELVSINTMKLVHFSTEQQTLCFLDNTLTVTEDCLELSERSILEATYVSASSQPDKIWVMDQLNSTLYKLPIMGNGPVQEVGNLTGLLNFNVVNQIKEAGNRLYMLTPEGIFVLDMYGSLVDVIRKENVDYFDANESHIYLLKDNRLAIRDVRTGATTSILVPLEDVREVKIVNGALFARTSKNVHKFELQMLD
jgi:DNA-binding beta-propeller fold protein YncE